MRSWSEIVRQIKLVVENCKDEVPQGYRLLEQRKIEDLDDAFDFLLELFDEEEQKISEEHLQKYVTDSYENGVRYFAKMIVEILLTHHADFRNDGKYEKLCGQRHIAYAYYSVINTGKKKISIILEVKYQRIFYLGLVEFYNHFYGNFADNEEAICLLPKDGLDLQEIDENARLNKYFDEIEDYYHAFGLLIDQIGEPIYKHNLRKMLEESSFARGKNKGVEKQISQLEEEKRKLQEKIDILKEKNQVD